VRLYHGIYGVETGWRNGVLLGGPGGRSGEVLEAGPRGPGSGAARSGLGEVLGEDLAEVAKRVAEVLQKDPDLGETWGGPGWSWAVLGEDPAGPWKKGLRTGRLGRGPGGAWSGLEFSRKS